MINLLIESVSNLIGIIPKGFDPVMYVICAVILVWVIDCFFHIFRQFIQFW